MTRLTTALLFTGLLALATVPLFLDTMAKDDKNREQHDAWEEIRTACEADLSCDLYRYDQTEPSFPFLPGSLWWWPVLVAMVATVIAWNTHDEDGVTAAT
jgi:hypothetical protein